ncbi:MAG: helix-turn-helix domain-containing protein [Desulfofustis sp.]|jgi:transcriptional regulator with XRE-family HTH domain|nr:helix-turn-helix domain-containing protein [Desulfofustis sp.]
MNEQNYLSSQVMIKIDGARIKAIREAKGLTQLYVATAVEVTTDTVSRWENRRYPTIKKENGLKLAQALEVELEDILDATVPEEPADGAQGAGPEPRPGTDEPEPGGSAWAAGQAPSTVLPEKARWSRRLGHLSFIIVALALIAAIVYAFSIMRKSPETLHIGATRVVPAHFIAGLPLPVFILVDKTGDGPLSIIMKENLPPGCRLQSAAPPLSGHSGSEIKWLTKIAQPATFFYTVVTEPAFSGTLSFSGTVKNGGSEDDAAIGGGMKTVSGFQHWADSDGDNRISDAEILAVYDLLPEQAGQIVDLDQLEEMWLGDGYVWDPERQQITIIE